MNNEKNILIELKNISPLVASIEKSNIFSVPMDYFETLSDNILLIIKEDNSQVNSNNDVPVGYFDNLAENILIKIKGNEVVTAKEEIKELSTVLYQLQSINPFKIPINYFNTLDNNISKLIKKESGKVLVIQKRKNIFKYAVAAVIAGAMALGVFKFTFNNSSIDNISLPNYVADGKKIENIDEELSKISDAEILQYLQNNGEGIDAELMTNSIDDMDLPNETDYFYNEKTMDDYFLENTQ